MDLQIQAAQGKSGVQWMLQFIFISRLMISMLCTMAGATQNCLQKQIVVFGLSDIIVFETALDNLQILKSSS